MTKVQAWQFLRAALTFLMDYAWFGLVRCYELLGPSMHILLNFVFEMVMTLTEKTKNPLIN